MIEQIFQMAQNDNHTIEKVITDENVNFNHMILNKSEGLPEHFSNSNVYMTILRGLLSIGLDEQEIHEYPAGTVLKIPKGIKMNVKNLHDDTLELIVVKAPAPGK
jgi:quercetin dioxygenase-like cupin family protein